MEKIILIIYVVVTVLAYISLVRRQSKEQIMPFFETEEDMNFFLREYRKDSMVAAIMWPLLLIIMIIDIVIDVLEFMIRSIVNAIFK